VPIRFSEFPFGFRNSHSVFGIPIRFSEFPFGFRNSHSVFGIPIRLSEFPFGFRKSYSDLGAPIRFPEFPSAEFPSGQGSPDVARGRLPLTKRRGGASAHNGFC